MIAGNRDVTFAAIPEIVEYRGRMQPERIAYRFLEERGQSEQALTYGELRDQVRAVAFHLLNHSEPGARIVLFYPPGLDYIVAFLGCLSAGRVAVPLYPPRPNQKLFRVTDILTNSGATLALTTPKIMMAFNALAANDPALAKLRMETTNALPVPDTDEWQEPSLTGGDLAFLQYTSGSTGAPKGVMVSHANLIANQESISEGFQTSERDICVAWLPLYHDMGLIGTVLNPLFKGYPSILMPPVSFIQDPLLWLEAISRFEATLSGAPNFAYALCAKKASPERLAGLDLTKWRVAFNGAEPIQADVLTAFARVFAQAGFNGSAYFPCYGMAEATLFVTGARAAAPLVESVDSEALKLGVVSAPEGEVQSQRLVGCGRTFLDTYYEIVDPLTRQICGPGQVGEIWITGSSVTAGYWGQRELTEVVFNARLADNDQRSFLRSGDLGFIRAGQLFITGRIKDLIIIRGRNYYPQDIELSVERCHPALRPGCGAAFTLDSEEDVRLVIAHEVKRNFTRDIDSAEVIAAVRSAIAEQHGLSAHTVVLLAPGAVPKTSSGKIRRRATREMLLDGSLNSILVDKLSGADAESVISAPDRETLLAATSEKRKHLLQAWLTSLAASVLKVEKVESQRSLGSLGIDSLAAMELQHRVETELGIELSLGILMEGPSIADLTTAIEKVLEETPSTETTPLQPQTAIPSRMPLALNQRSLWFLERLAPENTAYNLAFAFSIHSPWPPEEIRTAFETIVTRHAALQATFHEENGQLVQRHNQHRSFLFEELDATTWSRDTLQAHLDREARRPFDLAKGPLLRVLYYRTAAEPIVQLTVHHIAVDFRSFLVMAEELRLIYSNRYDLLKRLAYSYHDYVATQQRLLVSDEALRQRDFWHGQLGGELPLLALPTDFVRPSQLTFRGGLLQYGLPEDLRQGLQSLAETHQTTLYTVVMAVYQVLLLRYTGQEDIPVGTPILGRPRGDFDELIGYFVNTVVVRGYPRRGESFTHFLDGLRAVTRQVLTHHHYPFSLLAEEIQQERPLNRSPLFQAMMVMLSTLDSPALAGLALRRGGVALDLNGLALKSLALQVGGAQFDLSLIITDDGARLSFAFEYNADLFKPETMQRMASHFAKLLEAVCAAPENPLNGLTMLAPQERASLLARWSEAPPPFPAKCLHTQFEEQVQHTPNAAALSYITESGERLTMTYAELDRQADHLAEHLRRLGVVLGTPVAMSVDRTPEMIWGLIGILKAGGAYVPIDPDAPAKRQAFIIRNTQTPLLLTQKRYAESGAGENVHRLFLDDDLPAISGQFRPEKFAAGNMAYIIHTSGSTGEPKGVMMSHDRAARLFEVNRGHFNFSGKQVWSLFHAYFFDVSVWEMWGALLHGGRLAVVPYWVSRSPRNFFAFLAEEQVTELCQTPTAFSELVELVAAGKVPSGLALKTVNLAGEALFPARLKPWFDRFGSANPRISNMYGPTETTVYATFRVITEADSQCMIGTPLTDLRMAVTDADLDPVPAGVSGELVIGGNGLARGYQNRPDLTALQFVPDPFSQEPGRRLYRTGDLVRIAAADDLEYLGRIDDQVKIRGVRIELGEIETLLRTHPAVEKAAVKVWGKGVHAYLAAYLMTVDGRDIPDMKARVRAFLAQFLPDMMVPAKYIRLDVWPLTPSGKLSRRSLVEPDLKSSDELGPFEAARTPHEEQLGAIWCAVLGRERIGNDENFFHLGGHSLLATRLISEIRDHFHLEVPVREVFANPTIATLAQTVERMQREQESPILEPIGKADPEERIRLSFAQQRLWFLSELASSSADVSARSVYNMPAALRLKGALGQGALVAALQAIVVRHEILRTRIQAAREPIAVIANETILRLPVLDLRGLPLAERELEIQRLAVGDAQQVFDLTQGPLIRATLIKLSATEHVLLTNMHHIVSDGWSTGVLIRELMQVYAALHRSESLELAPLALQYGDYAAWQRRVWESGAWSSQLDYWRAQLADAPPLLILPLDRPRPAHQSYRGAKRYFSLDAALTSALQACSQQAGVTLFMCLRAAFAALLARYSHTRDLTLGTPVANRDRKEFEPLIGLFVNTLALRTNLGGDPSFSQLMARVRDTDSTAFANQDVPFEQVVEAVSPRRNMGYHPLFQVMFVFHEDLLSTLDLPGLELAHLEVERGLSLFDLSLTAQQRSDSIPCDFEYNTDLFDAETIARMIGHFTTLLAVVTTNPNLRLSRLPLMTEAEAKQTLVTWNDTAKAFPQDRCIHSFLEERARLTPDAFAVQVEAGSPQGGFPDALTFRELDESANRIAHRLVDMGIGPESLVGLCMQSSPELIAAVLGVFKAGAAYVPLDPKYPRERLVFMMDDARVAALLTQERLLHEIPAMETPTLVVDRDWSLIAAGPATPPRVRVCPENLVYAIYTSGSTGMPKSGLVTHRNLVNYALEMVDVFGIVTSDRILQLSSISWDVFLEEMLPTLLGGATLVLRADPIPVADPAILIEKESITGLVLSTAQWHQWVESLVRTERRPPACLRFLWMGGEQVQAERFAAWQTFGTPLIHVYGLTETTITNTAFYAGQLPRDLPRTFELPIGTPVANNRIYLLGENLEPVPVGISGELVIGGEGIGRGYHRRGDLTAARFIPDPFSTQPGQRLYKTGDLARYGADAQIYCLGRVDHQVKVRGMRIELGEIETLLLQHEAVRTATVIIRTDQPDNPRLTAYLVLNAGQRERETKAVLRAYLAERLPEFMIPAVFVVLNELPLSPNGKVDRQRLPAPAERTGDQAEYIAPQAGTEQKLATLWEEVLCIPGIGSTADFFEFGGHSLLAMQLISRVREVFSVAFSLRALFEQPTLRAMARGIDDKRAESAIQQPIGVVPRAGGHPLSFAQQRLWFMSQLEGSGSNDEADLSYHLPAAVEIRGDLDIGVLERSIAEIIARHEILRTNFRLIKGEPRQVPHDNEGFRIPVFPVEATAAEAIDQEIQMLLSQEIRKPFDLAEDDLIRLSLFVIGPQRHVLQVTMHHIVSDGWSVFLFIKEMAALYGAFSRNQPSPLAVRAIQYIDYVQWERTVFSDDRLQDQKTYWAEKLAGAPALLDLPLDRPRSAVMRLAGSLEHFQLDDQLSGALKRLAGENGVTLYMILLAGYALLLSKYSGQRDILVGTPVAHRPHRDLEELIGLFVNNVVMRNDLSGDPDFATFLGRVRETALDAFANQDIPFEQVVEAVQPDRNLSHSPLFQAFFALQNVPTEQLHLPGLQLEFMELEHVSTTYDLGLSMEEGRQGLTGFFEYNTAIFDRETIQRMADHFQTLLGHIVTATDKPVGDVSLMSAAERSRILVTWNDTAEAFASKSFIHAFEDQAALTPQAFALTMAGSERPADASCRLTYAALNSAANRLAHHLLALGAGPQQVIGLCCERSPEMVIAIMAILKSGAAYLPLEPGHPENRLARMLADVGAEIILTGASLQGKCAAFEGRRVSLSMEDLEPVTDACSDRNPGRAIQPEQSAYVIFTSGSTGQPKGVIVSHAAISNRMYWAQKTYHLSAADTFLQTASFAFDISLWEITAPLLAGANLLLIPAQTHKDPEFLVDVILAWRVTAVHFVPAMLRALLQTKRPRDLRSLRHVFCGGEAMSLDLKRQWLTSVETSLHHFYGPTEAAINTTVWECHREPAEAPMTLGRPIANTSAYILDSRLQPVPVGIKGELSLGGLCLADGYLAAPDLTAERFVPHPFATLAGARLYKTGDQARFRQNGQIEFHGRRDHQIKIRGMRVELGEIEARLLAHPAVLEAAVIFREDQPGQQRLVAYTVADPTWRPIEIWPSIAEFFVYDDLAYYSMITDEARNQRYLAAFKKVLVGKSVVEIGPGPVAILSRLAIQAGASKVYAIELLEETYQKAKRTIEELGLQDRIVLLNGNGLTQEIPEKVDYCISEIVGPIGGSEASAKIINGARRFLKDSSHMLPIRSLTKIAAISLPEHCIRYGFPEMAANYTQRIFDDAGGPFDLRICLKHLPLDHILTDAGVFEDLDYTQEIPLEETHDIRLTFAKDGLFHGFLVWLVLYIDEEQVDDILHHTSSWMPVYFPISRQGIQVEQGSLIEGHVSRRLCENQLNPDFFLDLVLRRPGLDDLDFSYGSYHQAKTFRGTPFYRSLFPENGIQELPRLSTTEEITQLLQAHLPDHMIPTIVPLNALPHTINGKLDSRALPTPEEVMEGVDERPLQTPTQVKLAELWCEVLGIEHLGRKANFFDLGGHSLIATRIMARIREEFGVDLRVWVIFEAQTIEALAERIDGASDSERVAWPPLTARPNSLPPELSFAQQRLWFLEQMGGTGAAYNMPFALELDGKLDLELLEASFQEIVRRHATLRTTFVEVDGALQVIVAASQTVNLPVYDLVSLPKARRHTSVAQLMRTEAVRSFDLAEGPLLRLALLRTDRFRHILLATMHHIISDGWSIGVLVRELGALYRAGIEGLPSPLSDLPVQYTDYAAWQKQLLAGENLARQQDYWRRQLTGAPPLLALPLDRPRPPVQSLDGRAEYFSIDGELTERLKKLSEQANATLFMTLLAAYTCLLSRYSGQDDILVGSPVASRTHRHLEPLIGFFVNNLALRGDLTGNPSFLDLLKRVRKSALDAYAHQDLPFEQVVELVQPERNLSYSPLFQAFFALQNIPKADLELPGLHLRHQEGEHLTTAYDLGLSLEDSDQGVRGFFEYNTSIFERQTIARLCGHFKTLLTSIAATPRLALAALALQTDEERQRLLYECNETRTDFDEADFMVMVEGQAARHPQRVALEAVSPSRPEEVTTRLTYGELNAKINQFAHLLKELGAAPGTVVAISGERSPEMVIGILAILKTGAAYLPLEPDNPPKRLAFMLAESGATILLAQDHDQPASAAFQGARVPLNSAALTHLIAGRPVENPEPKGGPKDLAYLMYTSGSTGQPKGVLISRGAIGNRLMWALHAFPTKPGDRFLQLASFGFDISLAEVLSPLLAGACLVLLPPGAHKDAVFLAETLSAQAITSIHLVPSMLRALLFDGKSAGLQKLGSVFCGGEAMSLEMKRRFCTDLSADLHHFYGPTEAAINMTSWDCRENPPETPMTIGRPIANTTTYVLDPQGRAVPTGVIGELHLGGACLAMGYLGAADLTAKKFVPHPYSRVPGERLYKSGDLARFLDNGCLEFRGRTDHQIKIRGKRVELGEIEAALIGLAPVLDVAVLLREDQPDRPQLVAYVVTSGQWDEDGMRRQLAEQLPEHMVPVLARMEKLPLTINGKLDRDALPAPFGPTTAAGDLPLQTHTQIKLAALWREVLGCGPLGLQANFFDLGGHSLMATRVVARIRAAFGLNLRVQTMFEAQTLERLAACIDAAERVEDGLQPPLQKIGGTGPFPLSFSQQRMWIVSQMEGIGATYNIPTILRLRGRLDLAALNWSLAQIVSRHQVLRTVFREMAGSPQQVILADSRLDIPLTELTGEPDRESQAEALLLADSQAPFQLSNEPAMRVKLVRLDADDHLLGFTLHHIITDGWSGGVMVRELGECYRAYVAAGEPPVTSPLPDLPLQYTDFSLWQRQVSAAGHLEDQKSYWTKQLRDVPELLTLPTDRPRPAAQTFRGDTRFLLIPPALVGDLNQLSRATGTSLYMCLQAAFAVLLSRYAGQEDICVGTAHAARNRPELEALIGFFVNTLVLRNDLSGDPTFASFLERVRGTTLDAFSHQDLPFEQVVDLTNPGRHLGHSPLFQVAFILQNAPVRELVLPELDLNLVELGHHTARFDLVLTVVPTENGLSGAFDFNTDLFDGTTIERLAQHYLHLLGGIVASPERKLWALPLMDEAERERVLVTWNETGAPLPAVEQTLTGLFEDQAARTPDVPAVISGAESSQDSVDLSYAELNERVNQLAHRLIALGVGPEVLVGVLMDRSVEAVIALLAILKAGGGFLPMAADYPAERLDFMVRDSKVTILVTTTRFQDRVPESAATVITLGAPAQAENWPVANPPARGEGANLAYVLYTSGSTGRPKGAMVARHALLNLCRWYQSSFELQPGSHVLQAISLGFDAAIKNFLAPLIGGATLVLLNNGPFDAANMLATIRHRQVHLLNCVSTMFYPLLALAEEGGYAALASLRHLALGGETTDLAQLRPWLRSEACNCHYLNIYGPTEATDTTTIYPMPAGSIPAGTPPIGMPIDRMSVYIVDRQLEPVPTGVLGELLIGGAGLARAYLGRPDLTAERFVPSPFGQSQRLYRSGDCARRLADGNIEFLGRLDNQVKLMGFRIEPGEVENTLTECPGIRQAVVLVREDVPGDRHLVAYCLVKDAAPATAFSAEDSGRIRAYLQARLPNHMIPAAFVPMAAFPLTAHGKIDRRALPVPGLAAPTAASGAAAKTETEKLLVTIWCEILGQDRIGTQDSFFELGGHSLTATQLISRVRKVFNLELPLQTLFASPTVAGLAEALEAQRQNVTGRLIPPLVPQPRTGPIPLSHAQQRLWLVSNMVEDSTPYHLPSPLKITGSLDVAALERTLAAIVARHEVLRTTFAILDNRPVQVIHPAEGWTLPRIDLRHMAPDRLQAAVAALVERHALEPFDLEQGPLLKVTLVELGERDFVLLFNMHHIVSDGWSYEVMVRELMELYGCFAESREPALADLPIQYADYAIWQRNWLKGEVWDEELGFWRRQLAGAPAQTLPGLSSRPDQVSSRAARRSFELPDELGASLTALSRRENVTMFMLLLAAFKAVLFCHGGNRDLIVGTDVANRDKLELEGLIGFFINQLVLRTDLSGNPGFRVLLERVRAMVLVSYAHQELPFDQLVEQLLTERHQELSPFFQIKFNVQAGTSSELVYKDLSLAPLPVAEETTKLDLQVNMWYQDTRIGGVFNYKTDLFETAAIARTIRHFQAVLEAVAATPDLTLEDLRQVLSKNDEAYRRELLEKRSKSNRPAFAMGSRLKG